MSTDPVSGVASLTTSVSQIVPADENRTSLILQNVDTSSWVEIVGPGCTRGVRLLAGESLEWYVDYRDESCKGEFDGYSQTGTVEVVWFAGRTDRKPFGGYVGGPM